MTHRHRSSILRTLLALLAVALAAPACATGGGAGGGTGAGTGGDPGTAADGTAAGQDPAADVLEPLPGPAPEPRLPVTVTSADGREVTVTAADRIVPLSGGLSEIVFTLGLGGGVVARDISTTFAEAGELPLVTRGHDVSAENVLALHPDVVLAESTTGPAEAVEQIRAAGVPLIVFGPAGELGDVDGRIRAVARALGVPEAGEELVARTAERIEAARRGVPETGERPRVAFLYLRGSASVYLLGGAESGAVSLIEAAGGRDAGAESGLEKDFTPLTSEALAAAAPDVILVMRKGLESVGGVDGLLEIPGIAQTPAGTDRRIAVVEDGMLLGYGPRTDRVLALLVAQIHGTEGDR
ncbi:ABC transporter substrate-binding protein [Streptomyces sp. YIM 98790]|uniref:heme/hemin ABC transporter substrate-binding protein n=1 Tax=Streptomyces sp. YIM 98790 TaxID=2689077 RepID=UPI00140A9ECB|nr:ABC transporter substrate-binding protein [Streptomyces sp. YIM 98790]